MAVYQPSDLYGFTRQLYQLLREEPEKFHLQKLGYQTAGKFERDTMEVFLDPRHDVLSVLIHEVIHRWCPDWCETKVLEEERKIITGLSDQQLRNIAKAWAKTL